jgi:hypothetical protein
MRWVMEPPKMEYTHQSEAPEQEREQREDIHGESGAFPKLILCL